MEQNYPNPFNPMTNIDISIPYDPHVSLVIYDLLGKEVTTLVSEKLPAGNYSRRWYAENSASGVYFCTLKAGTFIQTIKLVLLQ
jgi:hypothetical protein